MSDIDKLTEYFKEFPGIGPRQAKRFVYFLIRKNRGYVEDLAKLIPEVKNTVKVCESCFRYFPKNESVATECRICLDRNRDSESLIIVARDTDYEAIEKSGSFNGYYFILGGTIPVLEKIPSQFVRIKDLKNVIEKRIKNGLKEIVLALNANPEGDHTANYLKKELEEFNIKISILGRGLSTGSELEYSDRETILNALQNRK